MTAPDVRERAKRVRLFVVDIDGVMTDGRIVYSIYGDELKFFDVQDGFGITLLRRAGIPTVIVTAKRSRVVKARGRDLRAAKVYHGCPDKLRALKHILKRFRVLPEELCFVGDDLIDLPVLARVGFAVAVPNAVDEVKRVAHYVTGKPGGRGAVREICDLILKEQGAWERVTKPYFA